MAHFKPITNWQFYNTDLIGVLNKGAALFCDFLNT